MKCLTLVLVAGLAAGAGAWAEEAPVATAGYKLQTRSQFDISTEARNPFSPIGWSKEALLKPAEPERPKITLDANKFSLTSILMGVPRLAVINGRAYGEGEMMRAPRKVERLATPPAGGQTAEIPWQQVKVVRIADGSVLLACGESTVQVGLKRDALAERRQEEQPVFNEQ